MPFTPLIFLYYMVCLSLGTLIFGVVLIVLRVLYLVALSFGAAKEPESKPVPENMKASYPPDHGTKR